MQINSWLIGLRGPRWSQTLAKIPTNPYPLKEFRHKRNLQHFSSNNGFILADPFQHWRRLSQAGGGYRFQSQQRHKECLKLSWRQHSTVYIIKHFIQFLYSVMFYKYKEPHKHIRVWHCWNWALLEFGRVLENGTNASPRQHDSFHLQILHLIARHCMVIFPFNSFQLSVWPRQHFDYNVHWLVCRKCINDKGLNNLLYARWVLRIMVLKMFAPSITG